MDRIYFDYNATTPLAPEAAAAMSPFLTEMFGNPSSHHWAGERAHAAIDRARDQVAGLLNCQPSEVIFMSGGTEANNLALTGVYYSSQAKTPHFIISSVEHPSVAKTCEFLERLGAEVTRVPVDRYGQVDPAAVRQAIRANTALVSIMHANNEVGTVQPIADIAAITRAHGVLLHTDGAQTAGKISVDVQCLRVDLLTIAGHKLYAPQGVGALFIRNGIQLESLLHGAGHEQGRRAGTENVLEIVGLGAACELTTRRTDTSSLIQLRDHFWRRLSEDFGDNVVLNGHPQHRLPNTLNVSFVGLQGHEILTRIPELAASTGSACHAGAHQLSPVLQAIGVPEYVGLGAIRFSLGYSSSRSEIDWVIERLKQTVSGLR
jgi:cysteine desulfurase